MKESSKKPEASAKEAFSKERAAFRSLLLANPNYFGNLPDSSFQPVLPIKGNTFYEELKCVGYQPQQQYLEGVVHVYQPSGYGTGICGQGTREYVRFYLSYDNGASWQDVGLTAFQVHNIPEGTEGRRHLEYAVNLRVDPTRNLCFRNPLILVRAILSWNFAPPPNAPNWPPVWGNVREVTIQVEPWRFFFFKDLVGYPKFQLPNEFAEIVDLDAPVQTQQKAMNTKELSAIYKKDDVPLHRFAFKELTNLISSPQVDLNVEAIAQILPPDVVIAPNISDLLFPSADGDISYEELTCVGLDPNFPDTLVGVIKVKKPSGFSGGVCTRGSTEYVTFWGDFNGNGIFETCLGTAQVQVYDLPAIPRDGVYYAVRLPVNLSEYRQLCTKGAKVVRIRAILSWETPAPCFNPNYIPTWGNREETLIFITPKRFSAGKIAILGGIPVQHIHDVTGLTTASAFFADNNLAPDASGRPCPFGGIVTVKGEPVLGHTYVVEVSKDGLTWTPVLDNFYVTDSDGNTSLHNANPVTRRFDYLPMSQNVIGLIARWHSTGDDKWYVRLSVYDAAGVLQGVDTHLIQLDNTAPEANIDITIGPGNCGKFGVGDVLSGNFVARDTYLGSWSLQVEPAVNPPGTAIPSPASGTTNTPVAPGNAWTLDTTGMQPCGYIIKVHVWDRAILNSQYVGHYNGDSAGFCLEQ